MKIVLLLICFVAYAAEINAGSSSIMSCDFQTNNFCRWSNDNSNWMLNWKVTTNENWRNKIACIGLTDGEIRNMNNEIDIATIKTLTARLWGPKISRKNPIKCIGFHYRLSNTGPMDAVTKLTVMRREMGSCVTRSDEKTGLPMVSCLNLPIWNSKSDKSLDSQWSSANIDLVELKSDFKLILEGTIPSGNPNAKICVDNITSSAEPCKKPEVKENTNIPSYSSWVELYGMTFAGALALGLTIPIAVFIVCLFERKRRRGKKNNRIIRHADELDLPEGMNANNYDETNPLPNRYTTQPQVGVGNPRLMNRAMSTPAAGVNGQGGNYTMGKRDGAAGTMGTRTASGQYVAAHTMGRGNRDMESGWMMSSQHGDLMENDEYTIDPDYTTHRQMSVPANGYIPVANNNVNGHSSDPNVLQAGGPNQVGYRPIPQPQSQQQQQPQQVNMANSNIVSSTAVVTNNNPFGTPTTASVANVAVSSGQLDNRSIIGSHAGGNFAAEDNRGVLPGLPFYPPRYEEAMGFNHGQMGGGNIGASGQPQAMEEKPPLLPPRIPESSGTGGSNNGQGSSNSGVGPSSSNSCSTPLPPAPPPLPLAGHPSAGRFQGNEQQ